MRVMQAGLTGLCMVLAGVLSASAAGTTVAVVSMEKLIKQHPDTDQAEAAVQVEVDDFEAERKDMTKKFDDAKAQFDDARKAIDNKALTETERADKKAKAEELMNKLQDMQQELSDTVTKRKKDINEHTGRARKRIVEKIQAVVSDYAKSNRIDLVIDKDELSVTGVAGILFVDDKLDITDAVLKEILKDAPKDMPKTTSKDADLIPAK